MDPAGFIVERLKEYANLSFKRIKTGQSGEDLAAKYLRNKGYKIIQRNYRTKSGEIDLIAKYKNVLIFTEVKTRKSNFLETPLAAVTNKKMIQISKVAQEYLCKNNKFDCEARFDVISISFIRAGSPNIEHIENAFDLCYGNL